MDPPFANLQRLLIGTVARRPGRHAALVLKQVKGNSKGNGRQPSNRGRGEKQKDQTPKPWLHARHSPSPGCIRAHELQRKAAAIRAYCHTARAELPPLRTRKLHPQAPTTIQRSHHRAVSHHTDPSLPWVHNHQQLQGPPRRVPHRQHLFTKGKPCVRNQPSTRPHLLPEPLPLQTSLPTTLPP